MQGFESLLLRHLDYTNFISILIKGLNRAIYRTSENGFFIYIKTLYLLFLFVNMIFMRLSACVSF